MISVVVPIYNSEDTIAACIESIANQVVDMEIVLVDDGSNDGSGAICDTYAAADPRIIVVHQANKGRTVARHAGVVRARGEWVCFVDSDDTLPPDSLRHLIGGTADDVDIVLGNGYSLHGEKRNRIAMSEFRHLAVRAEGNIGLPWGSLYRRSVLTPYLFDMPRHVMMGEDYVFWLRLVFTTDREVSIVHENVYNKGDDHTSNNFKWTAGYAQELNELRREAIPAGQHLDYMADMIADRLENLYSVALWSPRSEWAQSIFLQELKADMATMGLRLPMKGRLFLALPFRWMRRLYSEASQRLHMSV